MPSWLEVYTGLPLDDNGVTLSIDAGRFLEALRQQPELRIEN
jgi:hypothetical protein